MKQRRRQQPRGLLGRLRAAVRFVWDVTVDRALGRLAEFLVNRGAARMPASNGGGGDGGGVFDFGGVDFGGGAGD
ncbi:MAG: hypothetical protein AAF656_08900 [Planctomycetota bacterium]